MGPGDSLDIEHEEEGEVGSMMTPSSLGQFTLWIVGSITELKMVVEPAICLPSPFLSFIDSILQVATQMAALLETPSSSLPSSFLWPCDSACVNRMWSRATGTSESNSVRKRLALRLLSLSFPQAETCTCPHQPQTHRQGQRLWEQGSRDAWPSLGLSFLNYYMKDKYPSILFMPYINSIHWEPLCYSSLTCTWTIWGI